MHDGSMPTLEAAVAHYASGGVNSPFKSPRIRKFRITDAESHDLIAFLNALTDREFLTDPALAGPSARSAGSGIGVRGSGVSGSV